MDHFFADFQRINLKIYNDLVNKVEQSPNKYNTYLRHFNEEFVCIDDYQFAQIMASINNSADFVNTETARLLIDMQFFKNKWIMQAQFLTFSFGFLLPFAINILQKKKVIGYGEYYETILDVLIQMSGAAFFGIEINEILDSGVKNYFEGWNYIEFVHYPLVLANLILQKSNLIENQAENIMVAIILVLTFFKTLKLLRFSEEYGFLIKMILQVFEDISPFL